MSAPSWEWIEKVIRIDTVTHHSNEELVRALFPLLEEAGLKVEEQKIIENGVPFKNLIGYSHAADTPDLLVLNTHLDTVSCGDLAAWTKTAQDPFKATRVRDRVYGLGTADVKLDFLCKLWAAQAARPWKQPFALVGTYGEERGLVGAEKLLTAKKVKPRYALVGEPSNLELIYAHKGHLVFTLSLPLQGTGPFLKKRWKGKAAHSSTPQLGENAIRKALRDILKRGQGLIFLQGGTDSNRVPDQCEAWVVEKQTPQSVNLFKLISHFEELEREIKKRRDTRFSPPTNTLSLNMATTFGGQVELTFDIRALPEVEPKGLIRRIERLAEGASAKLVALSVDHPLKGKKDNTLMKAAALALKECGIKPVFKTKASSTEAALYQQHGAEAAVFGPGISVGNVHRPNEYNSLRQLGSATRFYTHLLRQPLGGGRDGA